MRSIEEIYGGIRQRYAEGGVDETVSGIVSAMPQSPSIFGGRMANYLENKLIDFIFRGQNYVLPANLYIALYSTPIRDDVDAEELSGEGYGRVVVPRTLFAWAGTQGQNSIELSSGESGLTSNNVPIQFPVAKGEWGTALWWGILDAQTGGNMLYYGELLFPRTVYPGDMPITFQPGDMAIWIDT